MCVCLYMCVCAPHGWSLLLWQRGGHEDGGGRLGSGTVGRGAEINCDCDSGERRIKQRAIKDWHDLRLSAPPATGSTSKGNFSLSNVLAATFKISLLLISVNPCSALWEICVCGIVPLLRGQTAQSRGVLFSRYCVCSAQMIKFQWEYLTWGDPLFKQAPSNCGGLWGVTVQDKVKL